MRLFVAIQAPDTWREAAQEVQRTLPASVRDHARLVDAGNLHITLRFIGEVAAEQAPALDRALAGALPPVQLSLHLDGVHTFGGPARTSAVWLGVGGDLDALHALATRADHAVATALGVPAEDRPFTPHLTLARVRRQAGPRERRSLAEAVGGLPPPPRVPYDAREAVLLRSRLQPSGARYKPLAHYPACPGGAR